MPEDPETGGERTDVEGPGFEYVNRPCRDIVWLVFYLLLVGLTCGFGIYAGANKNSDASQLFHKDYHTDPDFCPLDDSSPDANAAALGEAADSNAAGGDDPLGRRLLQDADPEYQSESNDSTFLEFLDHAWVWILAATGAAVVMGFIFILLFSFFAAVMVYMVASLLVLVPLAAGIVFIVAYDDNWGWAYIAAAVVILIPLLCLHSQLSLTSKLLDLGADGIRDNLDLVFFSVCANIVLLGALGGLLGFGVLALTNGSFVPNDRLDLEEFPQRCVNRFGSTVDCCDWDIDDYVVGYWVLILIMSLWTIFLISQVRVYVVAGVVAQWYFADEETRGNMSIMKSLYFALGPSFGSLALSSLILTISNMIQRLAKWAEKQAEKENARCLWFAKCMSCLIGFIAYIIEWVTDYATVRMAITGESFFRAGKNIVKMLTDNLINAFAISWFPPIVLFVCSLLMSISVSAVLAIAARNTWNDEDDLTNVRAWSWYLFLITFVLMMSVLYFFSNLLIDAVNTIFVCFAIDRENKTEKNPKAHEVFTSMGVIGTPLAAQGTSAI